MDVFRPVVFPAFDVVLKSVALRVSCMRVVNRKILFVRDGCRDGCKKNKYIYIYIYIFHNIFMFCIIFINILLQV